MNLLISLEHRFYKYKGEYYDNTVYTSNFWKPYLEHFDKIYILARAKDCSSFKDKYIQVSSERIFFIEVPDYSTKNKNFKTLIEIFLFLFRLNLQEFDVVIYRTPCLIGCMKFLLSKKKYIMGVEVIGSIYDIGNQQTNIFKKIFCKRIYSKIVELQCKKADVASYVTKNYLQHRYKPGKTTYVYYWSDVLIPDNNFLNQERKFDFSDNVNLIYIANLVSYKGHEYLFYILKKIRDYGINANLAIIGDGPEKEKLLLLAKQLSIENNIIFTGYLRNEDIFDYLIKSDIYVSTSLTEGLPRAIIEAMACALPVFAFNVGGIHELLDQNCLIPPKKVKNMAEKIIYYIQNPFLLHQLSKSNLEKAIYFTTKTQNKERFKSYNRLKSIKK